MCSENQVSLHVLLLGPPVAEDRRHSSQSWVTGGGTGLPHQPTKSLLRIFHGMLGLQKSSSHSQLYQEEVETNRRQTVFC